MFENKYPYTDLSQLNLDWFLLKFKDLLAEQERVSGKVATLEEIVDDLKHYVHDYFDNLDVQNEINNKIDQMAADGSLEALLSPLVADDLGGVVAGQIDDVVADQIGGVVADQIDNAVAGQIDDAVTPKVNTAVTTWLNTHVDPVGSAVIVDNTLTIAGAAADAKETGDQIGLLNGQYESLYESCLEMAGALENDVAYKNGTYPNMSTGHADNADNLVSNIKINNKIPYLFRTTAGGIDVGNRKAVKKIIGGSVVWNQLIDGASDYITLENGHKYITILSGTISVVTGAGIGITLNKAYDLTLMFGSSIADYIYNLQEATFGAGVAWFRHLFPMFESAAYDAGTIISVKTSANVTIGFNLYNHTTHKAVLVGGELCQITGTYTSLSYVDVDGNSETISPDADGYFTPTNNGELTITGGNDTDTCVHFVYDGERDGEYEPYVKHTYVLDSNLELRGIPKLDASNNLYYDGDIYTPDGTVTRNYGIVDLGSLSWSGADGTFSTTISTMKAISSVNAVSIMCAKYVQAASTVDKSIRTNGIYVAVKDTAYEDAATLETALSGVYLVYPLATPTTESADAYTTPQIIDDWGTEEYIDVRSVPVPVGHDTDYDVNLKAKLETLPNNPDADGDYIMRRVNGINTWVLIT